MKNDRKNGRKNGRRNDSRTICAGFESMGGNDHIMGFREDGTVVACGQLFCEILEEVVSEWTDMRLP